MMTREQVAEILARIGSFDGRKTFDEFDLAAWMEAVGDLDFDQARDAVTAHYRESEAVLMPAGLRRLVKAERISRIGAKRPAAYPEEFRDDVVSQTTWLRLWIAAVGDGASEDRASEIASAKMGVEVPRVALVEKPEAIAEIEALARSKAIPPAREAEAAE